MAPRSAEVRGAKISTQSTTRSAWLCVGRAAPKAAADVLSGGRISVGVGVGGIRAEYVAVHEEYSNRGARMDEMIAVLDADVALQIAGLFIHHQLEPAHVGVAAGFDQLDHRMLTVALDSGQVGRWAGGIGEYAARGGMGEARLAHALGAGEQPGMVKPPRIFLKCSLKGFPQLGHSILILSVGSMTRLTHRTGFGS